jgi:predicted TIM-barrel fold metal-dependent hydrolase
VVDAHLHISTLYRLSKEAKEGGAMPVEPFDNSPLTLYDMRRYGVDMGILLPSFIGTTNEMQAKLVDNHPDKFRACCSDQTLKLNVWRGKVKWTLEAACEEVEAALKTGKFVGIGEFAPGGMTYTRNVSDTERFTELRAFMDLAAKYDVAFQFHEFNRVQLLSRLSREYPDVPIVFCHAGYSIGGYAYGSDRIRSACALAGRSGRAGEDNIYLETGTWPAEYYEIALKNPNVGAPQLIWTGADYGNVPQYVVGQPQYQNDPPSFTSSMKRWPGVPSYQTDFWGWALHQISKLKDWVTQDELNLILGGNAAKVYKLPVPFERMFPEGRPDLWGIHWKKSIPFIPKDQVQNPDYP